MVKWTDDGPPDPASAANQPPPRGLRGAWARHRPSAVAVAGVARCLVAAGLVLALLAFVTFRIGGSERGTVVAAVQAPTFAKLPRIVLSEAPADAAAPFRLPPARLDLASLWLRPALEYEQSFTEPPDRMMGLCRNLAAAGFAEARWQASTVFNGEWECSSPLIENGADDGAAFIVVRGSGERRAGSLMLKLNAESAADRARLIDRVEPVVAEFLDAAHVTASRDVMDRIVAGAPDQFATSFGLGRIVAEYSRPEVRVLNLVIWPTLDAPAPAPCAGACFARFNPPRVTLDATTQVAAR